MYIGAPPDSPRCRHRVRPLARVNSSRYLGMLLLPLILSVEVVLALLSSYFVVVYSVAIRRTPLHRACK